MIMNIAKYTSIIFLMLGLMSFQARAELNFDGIVETATQECEDLGNDAVAIQTIRFQEHSSINDIVGTPWWLKKSLACNQFSSAASTP